MLEPEKFDGYDEAEVPNSAKKRVQLELYKQNLYPFKCIGVVLGQTATGEIGYATGFLVSSCLVLTSAHTFCSVGKEEVIKIAPSLFFEFEQKGLNKNKAIEIT